MTGVSDLPADKVAAAIADATAAWPGAGSCSYLKFVVDAPEAGEVGLDFINRIVFREDQWCRPGPPMLCYDSSASAITTLFFIDKAGDPRDGEILDADIEVNAVDFAVGICDETGTCTTSGSGLVYDLPNILTHELGHLLGLDHTCWTGAGPQPTDGAGQPVPACEPPASLPAGVVDTTMFPFAAPKEIKKRTPETDDIAGLCGKYPLAMDPGTCVPAMPPAGAGDAGIDPASDAGTGDPRDDGGGCGCRTNEPTALVAGLAVLLVVRRRRRESPAQIR
jgi:MYXO-CTERM domain-containing protein